MKLLICALFALNTLAQQSGLQQLIENPFKHEDKFGGLSGLKPSVRVRLAQGVIEMLRDNLGDYGRSYINYDF